jgi:hypothetical protein
MNCTYSGASELRDKTLFQKGCPFGIEVSGEINTGNLKRLGSSYSIGRQRSLLLLPEWVLGDFTREATVQDLLYCLPGPQYPKFLSQF